MSLRLGDIAFLNSWPVTYALRQGLVGGDVAAVLAPPAELNRRLLSGELDASAVSSLLYLRHQEEFIPIADLCIRSDGGISSVLVVSRKPLEALKGKTIAISNQGATTPVLLKILLKEKKLRMNLEVSSLRYPEILEEYPAALLIGDEALVASQEESLIQWDLGEAWARETNLPFVFALWVVRKKFAQEAPEKFSQLSQALHASYEWSKRHPKELVSAMRKTFPWEITFLIRYLSKLSYDLDDRAWKGLRHFAWEAQRLGELPKGTRLSSRGTPSGARWTEAIPEIASALRASQ